MLCFRRFGAVFLTAALALSACDSTASEPDSPVRTLPAEPGRPINVGVATDLPGLGLFDPSSNNWSGFDIELYRWLGNFEPKFTPVPVDLTIADRVNALKEGRVQLVVNVFSITDERRKSIRFAGPYLITQQGVLVRAGEGAIRTINDLAGKVICTISGSTSLDQLNQGSLRDQIIVTVETGHQECVDRLLTRQVDAFSTDQLVLHGFANSDKRRLAVVPGLTFGAKEQYGIGLPYEAVEECNIIKEKIKGFITSGAWNQFFQVYFRDLDPAEYKPDPYSLDPCE